VFLKVAPAACEAAQDIAPQHVMTASFDPSGYTAECQLRRRDAQIDGFDPPAGSFSTLQSNDETADATQGALEGKIISIIGKAIKFSQKQAHCRECRQFRTQCREPDGDQIRIDEMNYTCLLGQELTSKYSFTCSIRSCNDDATRR
jgi:hypothetical protein